jgi:hypothetical protein
MDKERLKELREGAEELINCGSSKEKSRGYGMLEVLDELGEDHSPSSCTVLLLISSNPADHGDPVIERVVFTGDQENIDNAVRDQLIEWAENYFDLDERRMEDFRDEPDYYSQDSECTGDYTVVVENNCSLINTDIKDEAAEEDHG